MKPGQPNQAHRGDGDQGDFRYFDDPSILQDGLEATTISMQRFQH
jgi:hypothetical protein